MPIRENSGYTIIGAVMVKPTTEVVLGKRGNDYVTWECADGECYYWGHYFNNLESCKDAFDDFVTRVRGFIK